MDGMDEETLQGLQENPPAWLRVLASLTDEEWQALEHFTEALEEALRDQKDPHRLLNEEITLQRETRGKVHRLELYRLIEDPDARRRILQAVRDASATDRH